MEGRLFAATISTLSPRFKLNYSKPSIENFVFRLHYKVTVTILVTAVILVCAREFFGDHIKCISSQGVPENVIQTYCFFMATFTIVRHYNESLLQSEVLPHPGVGPLVDSDEKIHHTYYQWVPFVLFIQAICFYMPHYVWKKKEGGRIKALVDGLQYATLSLHDEDMTVDGKTVPSKKNLEMKLDIIRKDILLRLKISRTWSTWMVAMEVVNLVHVMFEIWITNVFLNGHFISLGSNVLSFKNWDGINDPLETVFPKVTKCLFHKYGPSGSIQQHDALCVMALNIIHEKIYVVLWFWFLILFIASVLAVMWRILSFFMYKRSVKFNDLVFGHTYRGKFNPHNVVQVVNGCAYADWLFVYYLGKNMTTSIFQQLYVRLAEELQKRELSLDDDSYEKKGGEPELLSIIEHSDETLPLKAYKKSE